MRRKLTKPAIMLRRTGSVLTMLAASGCAFSIGYWLSRWYYKRHEVDWPDYAVQFVNWYLGIFILLLIFAIVMALAHPKQKALWQELIGAMRKIAKGDFSVVLDRDNKMHGQFGAFVQSINEMTRELKQMEMLRQEFISNVSHEIQSPLTSIRGFASTLQRDDLSPEERNRYLSIIEKETSRLSKISDNLLKLTTLESGQEQLDARRYRLDLQLEGIVLASEPQWLEKELELELELPETDITANEELLGQVWVNLIHNAIKFTPLRGSVKVLLRRDGDEIKVRIEDTGIGIAKDDRQRIFERFYKGDKQRTRTVEGSGLGLSIVKKIVELHHGRIEVDSRLGEGSVFEVGLQAEPGERPVDLTKNSHNLGGG
ncbi:sensor histidine kinase [Paenibacillus arenilitoris]|uniref:histidine kinase n=1 Tax=Paenibacillus arenilitoris TaxID=2772299 RepID=A0A927CP80_9BACL|nr:HAMP domain-containing sensor histidine kinase [Paenibacillus arenilitoris]MBD2870248.1 two-component sensor histidine kinase [Paenibacillus arenilitoris]